VNCRRRVAIVDCVDIQCFIDVVFISVNEWKGLPVKTVATDENYSFRRLGVHWSIKVSSVFLEGKLRKCVC
jgi:hypothetical protein